VKSAVETRGGYLYLVQRTIRKPDWLHKQIENEDVRIHPSRRAQCEPQVTRIDLLRQ